jgi:hypothetical protein
MKRPWLSPIVLSVALAGCGGDPEVSDDSLGDSPQFRVAGCEAVDHSACDVRGEACQTRLLALAACLRGDEPGALPPITLMTEQEYADYLNDLIALDPPPDPNHYEAALTMLGLVEPGAFSPGTVVAESVARVWGVYRADKKDILLIDHGADSDAESASNVLVHEFVHVLQDRDVDLAAFQEEHVTSYDSSLATRAVVEGEARLHQTRHWASLLGLNPAEIDWRQRFQGSLELGEAWVLEQPSPYSATRAEFPYAWGARYMHFAWEQGGLMGVLERFASPPKTSRALMASADGIAQPDATPIVFTAPTAPAPWTPAAENVLGAWSVFLAFATVQEPESARALALAWRGDGLFVYADPTSAAPRTAVVWRMDFADDTSASLAAQVAAGMAPPLEVWREGTRVTLARSDSDLPLDWAFSP